MRGEFHRAIHQQFPNYANIQHVPKEMNGSGQQSRKCHFVLNFQVCQNPPRLYKLICVMWKDVPVCFSPKSREKRLDKQAQNSTPTPHCSSLLKTCWIWTQEIWTPCAGLLKKYQDSFNIIRGHTERGGWSWGRLSCLCATFSHLLVGKNINTGTSFHSNTGRLAKFGSILTYLKTRRNGTCAIVARSHSNWANICTNFEIFIECLMSWRANQMESCVLYRTSFEWLFVRQKMLQKISKQKNI